MTYNLNMEELYIHKSTILHIVSIMCQWEITNFLQIRRIMTEETKNLIKNISQYESTVSLVSSHPPLFCHAYVQHIYSSDKRILSYLFFSCPFTPPLSAPRLYFM